MKSEPAAATPLWKEIGQGVVWANATISLLAFGSQAAALKALGLDEFVHLGSLLGRTAPLSAAFALIAAVVIWQWRESEGNVFVPLLVAAVSLAVATATANWLGDLRVTSPVSIPLLQGGWFLGDMAGYSLGMLASYYLAYGASTFCSSLVLGSLLGWTWWKIYDRHLAQSTAAAAPSAASPLPAADLNPTAESEPAPTPRRRRRRAA